MRGLRAGCVVVFVLLAFATVASALTAATIVVRPGESIQAAINAAPAGAVIALGAGEWQEALAINKPLTLRGAGPDKTTIRGRSSDRAVITANDQGAGGVELVLEDLAVTGARRGIWLDGSLRVRAARVAVVECVGTYGVFVDGNVLATLAECTIASNDEFGIATGASARATLVACTLANNGSTDVGLLEASRVTLLDCSLGGSSKGVWAYRDARVTLAGCRFTDSGISISLRDAAQATAFACTLSGSRGSALLLQGTSTLTIFGSTIASGLSGADLQDSSTATFFACRIFANAAYGVSLQESARATLVGNEIARNGTVGVQLVERPCVETSAVFSGLATGRGNRIPGPGEAEGNALAGPCAEGLSFLTTEVGGTLDRR